MSIKGITVNIDSGSKPKVSYVSQNSSAKIDLNNGQNYRVNSFNNSFSVKMDNGESKVASVNYSSTSNIKVNDQKDYKVKSFKYEITGTQFLRDLLDVSLSPAIENGSFLIYDLDLDKFITRTISAGDINLGNIDAGIF